MRKTIETVTEEVQIICDTCSQNVDKDSSDFCRVCKSDLCGCCRRFEITPSGYSSVCNKCCEKYADIISRMKQCTRQYEADYQKLRKEYDRIIKNDKNTN